MTHEIRLLLPDDMELIMKIDIAVVRPVPGLPITAECFAGEEVALDLAALNGREIEVRSIGTPEVGQAVLAGTVVRYTAPADFEGLVQIPYDSRQKLGPVRVG